MAYKIGSVQFVDGELYRPQIIQVTKVEGMKPGEIVFVRLNNTAIANSVSGQVALFTGKVKATPPTGFDPLTVDDFEIYINGRRVPSSQVTSITQLGTSMLDYAIQVTIDTPAFFEVPAAVLAASDEVVIVGKFN
jgi:hypothetical protein